MDKYWINAFKNNLMKDFILMVILLDNMGIFLSRLITISSKKTSNCLVFLLIYPSKWNAIIKKLAEEQLNLCCGILNTNSF